MRLQATQDHFSRGLNLNTKTVVDLLNMWGEWEREGKNSHFRALQPRSNMLEIGSVVVGSAGNWVRCNVTDDQAATLCGLMARIKRDKRHHYDVLMAVHVEVGGSVRRLAVNLKISRDEADKRYQHALGYVEAVFEDNDIDRLVG